MKNKISTILTVYKRQKYLKDQIKCIENQSISSDIFINWNTKSNSSFKEKYPGLSYINTNDLYALHNRFYSALALDTPYVFICDDDVVPGSLYLEKCLSFLKNKKNKALIGIYGMIFNRNETKYNVKTRIGAVHNNLPSKPKKVHMVGQGYFMHKSILHIFAASKKISESNEDISLAFTLYKKNIPIYVLDVDKKNINTYPDIKFGKRGSDKVALWKSSNHQKSRDKLMNDLTLNKNWKFS